MKQVFILDVHQTVILQNALIKYFHPGNKLISEDDLQVIQKLYSYFNSSDNVVDESKEVKIEEIIYG